MDLRKDDKGESDKGSATMRRTNEGANVTLKDIPQVNLILFHTLYQYLILHASWHLQRPECNTHTAILLLFSV